MFYTKRSWTSARKQNGFDSKFEAGYAQELELKKKAKEIIDYQTQVVIPLIVNGYTVCTYKIDFIVEHCDGTKEYVETKGYATDTWKLKWKLFEALFSDDPKIKLTVVYQGKSWRPRLRKSN